MIEIKITIEGIVLIGFCFLVGCITLAYVVGGSK